MAIDDYNYWLKEAGGSIVDVFLAREVALAIRDGLVIDKGGTASFMMSEGTREEDLPKELRIRLKGNRIVMDSPEAALIRSVLAKGA